MRNIVSFYMGWILFSTVEGFCFMALPFAFNSDKSFRIGFWIVHGVIFGITVGSVYTNIPNSGSKSLIGFIIVYVWIVISSLTAAYENRGKK
jgi:hypothetical protein